MGIMRYKKTVIHIDVNHPENVYVTEAQLRQLNVALSKIFDDEQVFTYIPLCARRIEVNFMKKRLSMKTVSLEAVEKCFEDMFELCGQNETEWNEYVCDFWDRFYLETNS